MTKLLTITLILAATPALAGHLHPEKFYQERWCEGKGEAEYVLPDRTRVDCLTDTHAVEHDFAKKWAESIGQALYYASQTGKKAGVVLILENPEKDQKYLDRLRKTIAGHNLEIDVWTVRP